MNPNCCVYKNSLIINHPMSVCSKRCLEWDVIMTEDFTTCKTSQGWYCHPRWVQRKVEGEDITPGFSHQVSRPWKWDALGERSSNPRPTRLSKPEPELFWGESSHWAEQRVNSLDFKLKRQMSDQVDRIQFGGWGHGQERGGGGGWRPSRRWRRRASPRRGAPVYYFSIPSHSTQAQGEISSGLFNWSSPSSPSSLPASTGALNVMKCRQVAGRIFTQSRAQSHKCCTIVLQYQINAAPSKSTHEISIVSSGGTSPMRRVQPRQWRSCSDQRLFTGFTS